MQRSDSAHTKHFETPQTDVKLKLSTHQTLWNTRDKCKDQTQRTQSTVKHQRQMQSSDSAHTKHTKHCETPETDAKLRLSPYQTPLNTRDRCKAQTQRTPNTVKHQRQMQRSDSVHTKHSKHCETPETDAKLRGGVWCEDWLIWTSYALQN